MSERSSIINVITTPLGFFALALLILEGFLGIVLIGPSGLTNDIKAIGLYIASGAFFGLIFLVTLLVWFKPLNLTLQGKDWNERAKDQKDWGDSKNPQTRTEVEKLSAVPSSRINNKGLNNKKQG
jgi:heme A synthase